MFLLYSIVLGLVLAISSAHHHDGVMVNAHHRRPSSSPISTFVPSRKRSVVNKKSSSSLKAVTDISRGGAGPLDPETTAKAFALIAGTQGLLFNVSPKDAGAKYGTPAKDNTDTTQYLTSMVGCGILSTCVALYCMLFKGTSLATATTASYILGYYHMLRMVLNGQMKNVTANGDTSGGWTCLAIFTATIYALQQEYADTAMKVASIWWLLNGLTMIVSPAKAWELWKGDKSKLNESGKLMLNCLGYYNVAFPVLTLSMLMKDATPVQAVGYQSIVWAGFHLINNLCGNFKKAGLNEEPQWIWFAIHAVIIATTLL